MEAAPNEVSRLLRAWESGDRDALAKLTPLVYNELRDMAHRYMRREKPDDTLQTTALVNEAYLRLVGLNGVRWQDRAHFFAVSAQIMRRILVDAARARHAEKRGGKAAVVDLNESIDAMAERDDDLIALNDALEALARFDPRKAEIVEMRFFGGLNIEEVAEVLQISSRTVLREWQFSRSWLMRELSA